MFEHALEQLEAAAIILEATGSPRFVAEAFPGSAYAPPPYAFLRGKGPRLARRCSPPEPTWWHGVLTLRLRHGSSRWRLLMPATPEGIRARAQDLRRQKANASRLLNSRSLPRRYAKLSPVGPWDWRKIPRGGKQ